jgi:phospholipid/cholesterol/gamma-HCH transport system substrate-binding protein
MKTRHTIFWTSMTVVIVGALVAGYLLISDRSESVRTGYCAMLPDAIGLYPGNPVTQMGYQVGTIESIDPTDSAVRVEFDLVAGRAVPAGAKAVTRSKSVLADNSLELVGNYADGPELEPAECISRVNSYSRKSISEITGSAADLIDQLAPDGDTRNLEAAIGGAAMSFGGTGDDLAELMSTASVAADNPEPDVANLGSIIVQMAPLTGDALVNWEEVASIMERVPHSAQVAGEVLWPAAQTMMGGLIPMFQAITDIQGRYGEQYIWPTTDVVADVIHIAALRVPDVKRALEGLPALASDVALIASRSGGHGLRVATPRVAVPVSSGFGPMCAQMNARRAGSCIRDGARNVVRADLADLIAAGVADR